MSDGVVVRDRSGRPLISVNDGIARRFVVPGDGSVVMERWDGSAWITDPEGTGKAFGDGVPATPEMLAALGVPVEDSTPPVR